MKAGGTTRRPLVLQLDRGRILFRTEVQHVGYQSDQGKAGDRPRRAQEPPDGFFTGGLHPESG